MAEKSTFVKIDRNIVSWRWFQNKNTLIVWLWLLMAANIRDHDFESDTIRRGEVATSRKTISVATGLTENEVRTALGHLKATGEITVRIRPKYQVISILNYDMYQENDAGKSTGRSPAGHRQSTGRSPQSKKVRNKEGKNGKNSCGDTTTTVRVPPLREDVDTYCRENGISTDVDAFINYNAARGWKRGKIKAADWRPLLMQWISKDSEYGQNQQEPTEKEFE